MKRVVKFKNINEDSDEIEQVVDIADNDDVFMNFISKLLSEELNSMYINGVITIQQYHSERGKIRKIWLNGNYMEIINFIAKRKSYDECDRFIYKIDELKDRVYSNVYVKYMGKYYIYNENIKHIK